MCVSQASDSDSCFWTIGVSRPGVNSTQTSNATAMVKTSIKEVNEISIILSAFFITYLFAQLGIHITLSEIVVVFQCGGGQLRHGIYLGHTRSTHLHHMNMGQFRLHEGPCKALSFFLSDIIGSIPGGTGAIHIVAIILSARLPFTE